MGEKSKDTSHQKINYPNENVKMIFDNILSGLTHSIFFFLEPIIFLKDFINSQDFQHLPKN